MDRIEERISGLENRTMQITQLKNNEKTENKQSFKELWDCNR